MKGTKHLIVVTLLAGCGGAGDQDPVDAAEGVDADVDAAPMIDAMPDAPPEPMPPFTVAASLTGSLAVDDAGLRPTFRIGNQTYYSYVALSLRAEGAQQSCEVLLRPAFVAFDSGSTSTRQFKTLLLNPSQSAILEDRCGWDDTHILSSLASIGVIEVGFARARFDNDRPYLDVFLDGDDWLPAGTANIVYTRRGIGSAMAEDGTVDENVRVEPAPGTLVRALYDF